MPGKIKIGLVLAGGGARGLAHIGLLRQLEKEGIKVDYIMGVSMGAIIGALYAYYLNADKIQQICEDFITSDQFEKTHISEINQEIENDNFWGHFARRVKQQIVINIAAYKSSLVDKHVIEDALHSLLKNIKGFDDLKLPFSCIATDLISGEAVILDKGHLFQALSASATIPGFLPPMGSDHRILVDGAVANNIPADLIRKKYHPDIVIVSDVSESIDRPFSTESIYDIIIRSSNVTHNQYRKHLLHYSDIIVEHTVGSYPWYMFEKYKEIIIAGEESAKTKMGSLKKMIKEKSSFFSFIRRKKFQL